MATSSESLSSIAHQYPQPSRPLGEDYTCHELNDLEQNRVHNHEHHHTLKMLKGFVDELDERGFEKFKKLASKVEKKVPIERLFKETLHDFKGRPVSEVFEKFVGKLNSAEVNERDLNGDMLTVEGEELRNERFKVKTVNVPGVGVVKEE